MFWPSSVYGFCALSMVSVICLAMVSMFCLCFLWFVCGCCALSMVHGLCALSIYGFCVFAVYGLYVWRMVSGFYLWLRWCVNCGCVSQVAFVFLCGLVAEPFYGTSLLYGCCVLIWFQWFVNGFSFLSMVSGFVYFFCGFGVLARVSVFCRWFLCVSVDYDFCGWLL